MNSIINAFIPTFILFSVFARITALDDGHRHISSQFTGISLTSMMLYFSYLAPLLYAILFLTQLLVIGPLWRKLSNKLTMIVAVLIACLTLSIIISYIAWSPESGYLSLFQSIGTLFAVQAVYWSLNFLLIFMIGKLPYLQRQPTL